MTYAVTLVDSLMSATAKDVRVSRVMAAVLTGRGLAIQGLHLNDPRRAVLADAPTVWDWYVTPEEVGELEVEVRALGFMELNGDPHIPMPFEIDRRKVVVRISPWGLVRRHHQLLISIVGLTAAIASVPVIARYLEGAAAPVGSTMAAPQDSPSASAASPHASSASQ